MKELTIHTEEKKQVVDITDTISEVIKESEYKEGVCHIFVSHTTAALTTADLDPGTDLDMLDAFEAIVPELNYRHPHDPTHVGDHIMTSIIGTDVSIPFIEGKLKLGTWQRVVLIEFDGPRKRDVTVSIVKG